MSTTTRDVAATPDTVWEVLADGWLYPLWVVGASRTRDVDASWPEVGARIHHSVGAWPVLVDDTTHVVEVHPRDRIRLRAKAWPFGEADVTITVTAHGAGTRVEIREDAAEGPGRLMPSALRQPLLHWRNTETLRRLALICENRPTS